jgi:DNA polymerase-1
MGVVAFSKTSGLPRKQAQEFIDRYFTHFSSIKAWQSRIKKEIHSRGYTQTISGRRRYFDGISSFSPQLVSAAERAGINFPIQGLGADILKLSMIAIEKDFIQRGWWGTSVHMLLTIHDELLFEVSDDMIETVIPVIRHLMENIFPHLGVPLVVDVSVGKQWGAMKKVSR